MRRLAAARGEAPPALGLGGGGMAIAWRFQSIALLVGRDVSLGVARVLHGPPARRRMIIPRVCVVAGVGTDPSPQYPGRSSTEPRSPAGGARPPETDRTEDSRPRTCLRTLNLLELAMPTSSSFACVVALLSFSGARGWASPRPRRAASAAAGGSVRGVGG